MISDHQPASTFGRAPAHRRARLPRGASFRHATLLAWLLPISLGTAGYALEIARAASAATPAAEVRVSSYRCVNGACTCDERSGAACERPTETAEPSVDALFVIVVPPGWTRADSLAHAMPTS